MKPKPRSLAEPLNGSRCHLFLHGPGTWNARQRILWRFYEPTYLRAAPEGAACLTAAGRARLVLILDRRRLPLCAFARRAPRHAPLPPWPQGDGVEGGELAGSHSGLVIMLMGLPTFPVRTSIPP